MCYTSYKQSLSSFECVLVYATSPLVIRTLRSNVRSDCRYLDDCHGCGCRGNSTESYDTWGSHPDDNQDFIVISVQSLPLLLKAA